jgi:hypothetical protein
MDPNPSERWWRRLELRVWLRSARTGGAKVTAADAPLTLWHSLVGYVVLPIGVAILYVARCGEKWIRGDGGNAGGDE